jgi:hypothetical protein
MLAHSATRRNFTSKRFTRGEKVGQAGGGGATTHGEPQAQ